MSKQVSWADYIPGGIKPPSTWWHLKNWIFYWGYYLWRDSINIYTDRWFGKAWWGYGPVKITIIDSAVVEVRHLCKGWFR